MDGSPTKRITPATLENVTVGHHKIQVTKEGYHSQTRKIYLCTGKTREMIIELEPIIGSIVVYSTPSGARVYLDDVDMKAITPCMLSEVVVGQHTIKLTKSDYFNLISNVSVSVGRTFHLHENLIVSPRYGSLDIFSDPSGAKMYLDDDYMNDTPCMLSEVVVGPHTIKLTKFGYYDVIRNVSVSVGETRYLNENLTGYGSLRISSKPSKAEVHLDGVFKGITPLDIDEVVEGSYFIKLKKLGYDAVEKKIEVSAGIKTTLNESLSSSPWLILLAMLVVLALEEATVGFIKKGIKRIIRIIRGKLKKGYVFSWGSVPGDDDENFKKTLRDDFDIGWAEKAKVDKLGDGKTISISKDENSAEITIDEKNEKATLKIRDCRTIDLKVKGENGKLNIYKK